MSQAVSRWSVTAEARVRARVSPFGICGGQCGTGTGMFSKFFDFPCQYHSTMCYQSLVCVTSYATLPEDVRLYGNM
jgi:hypothetical protein